MSTVDAAAARELPAPPTMPNVGDTIPLRSLADNAAVRQRAGGITRHTLIAWRADRGFPAPVKTPHVAGDLWDLRAIDCWLEVHRDR